MEDARVTQIQEIYLPDVRGAYVAYKRVFFKIGLDGPFTRDFPSATFSAAAVQLAIDADAREHALLKRL